MYTGIKWENLTKWSFFMFFFFYPFLLSTLGLIFLPKVIHEIISDNIWNYLTIYGLMIGFISTMLSILLTWYHIDEEKSKKITKELWYTNPQELVWNFKKLMLLNTYISLTTTIIASITLIIGYWLYVKENIYNNYNLRINLILIVWYWALLISLFLLYRNLKAFLIYNDKIEFKS